MYRSLFLIVLPGFLAIFASAQTNRQLFRQAADRQILMMHKSTLVVRLKSNDRTIEAYRKSGKNKLADKLELENTAMNLYLVKAFLLEFNFCTIRFIKTRDSRKLQEHQPYIFLNDTLGIDSTIVLKSDSFFVCDFGDLMDNERVDESQYSVSNISPTSTPATATALVISDTNFVPLKEPFPYYADVPLAPTNYKPAPAGTNKRVITQKQSAGAAGSDTLEIGKELFHNGVAQLNKKLIKYYVNVAIKVGRNATEDPYWWEDHNPNNYSDKRITAVEKKIESLFGDQDYFDSGSNNPQNGGGKHQKKSAPDKKPYE